MGTMIIEPKPNQHNPQDYYGRIQQTPFFAWSPPPEGTFFCRHLDDRTQRRLAVTGRTRHYRVYFTTVKGFATRRLLVFHSCLQCFVPFRKINPAMPPVGTPLREENWHICPHLRNADVKVMDHVGNKYKTVYIKQKPWGYIGRTMPRTTKYYTTKKAYLLKGVRRTNRTTTAELWRYFCCLYCYLMHRALIPHYMPLSYGYEEPNVEKNTWGDRPYGLIAPPWPPRTGERAVKACHACGAPTVHIDGECCFMMHDLSKSRKGYYKHCGFCHRSTRHRDGSCTECDGVDTTLPGLGS